jgi:TetR/AcrR family transcriptional regulator, cholesterol catabolism regulator
MMTRGQPFVVEGGEIAAPAVIPVGDGRREAILDVAAKLFRTHGYDATSVRDIARAAGISQATLYYYIGSKPDALVAISNQAMDAKVEDMRAIAESSVSPIQKLRDFVHAELASIDRDQVRFAIIQRERSSLPPEARAAIQQKRDQVDRTLTRILEEGVANGQFRPLQVKSVRMAILGMTNRAAEWYSPGGPTSARQFADDFCDLIFNGVLPRCETYETGA